MYNLEYFTKTTFNAKLNNAISIRYGNSDNDSERKMDKAFYDDFRSKYPDDIDISQAVRSWRSYSNNNISRLPQLKQLIQLCNVLECDIDYFLTPQENLKKEVAKASITTGLSNQAIEHISELKNSKDWDDKLKLQCLEHILSDNNILHSILNSLAYLLYYIDISDQREFEFIYDAQEEENEHSKHFIDRIGETDFFYHIECDNRLYTIEQQFGQASIIILELAKELENTRQLLKPDFNKYNGEIKIRQTYKIKELPKRDSNIDPFQWAQIQYNKKLEKMNKNLIISFDD